MQLQQRQQSELEEVVIRTIDFKRMQEGLTRQSVLHGAHRGARFTPDLADANSERAS